MNFWHLHKRIILAACLLTGATACEQEYDPVIDTNEATASLSLQFNMTVPVVTKGGCEEQVIMSYVFEDGELRPTESTPVTRAGDGNTADGGGMADLTVFLVDNTNDRIVARKSISDLTDVTTHHINFPGLAPGEYSAYAYANTEGNDWFTMPSANETSFASYKDGYLKRLSDGVPVVQNGRMPLTGKQDITVTNGNNSRTISMKRPVGRLKITAINEKNDALTIDTPSLGEILPTTGYVFDHNGILSHNSSTNPYHPVKSDEDSHTLIPGSYHVICNTLLYETVVDAGIQITMEYKGADYTFKENLSGNLNQVKQESLLIKLYNASGDSTQDLFLGLTQTSSGTYQLELVPVHDLNDKCFWKLSSAGKQQRGITNLHYGVSLNMENGLSFSNNIETFKFGGSRDYTTIGDGSKQLTYNQQTGQFSVSGNGTYFQFFTYVEDKNSGMIESYPIKIEDITSSTQIPLISIKRNQDIQLNIIFR